MIKLAIISSHPIQYNAPLFKLLNDRGQIQIKVFYSWGQTISSTKYDPGFGKEVNWDIPLLDGYEYSFAENISKDPGTHHFNGINNPALVRDIEEWEPGAILVYGWSFKSHLKCIRYFHKKIPVLFRGDSNLLDETKGFSIRKIIRKRFLKWVYRHVDKALYVGSANKDYYLKYGLKDEQLVFAPHTVDNARFEQDPELKENEALTWRRDMGIPDSGIVFLFAGKLEPKKDAGLMAKAFAELNLPGAHLLIIGNGILESSLNEQFASENNIRFLPFQNQQKMPVVYRLADIFVLPSRGPGETWGLSINEAMVCGRAVLVSDKCGAAIDLVKDGQNGYIFRSGDKADLSEKMRIMAEDKSRLLEMGRASRTIIESWNLETVAEILEKTVNEITS